MPSRSPQFFRQYRDRAERAATWRGRRYWVVSRSLCGFRLFRLANVGRNELRDAAALKAREWAPYAETGYHLHLTGEAARIWVWDAARVRGAMQATGVRPGRITVLPETALQARHEVPLPADDVAGCLPDVHRFRARVRGVVEALASRQPLPQADMQTLEAALSAPTGSLTLLGHARADEPAQLGFATDAHSTSMISFQIALSLALFLGSAERKRLKLCANPGCGFAFVDTSINATRRWCFMRYCGNRVKVRAFRGRRKTGHAGP